MSLLVTDGDGIVEHLRKLNGGAEEHMTTIDSKMKYEKQQVTIRGKTMSFVDTGEAGDSRDVIVFFHGNITSSYM